MTATLTPAEAAEVTRFGIHDEEILAHIEERFHDVPQCTFEACTRTATFNLVPTCCDGDGRLICTECLVEAKDGWDVAVFIAGGVVCAACGHEFGSAPRFEDVVREVPL